MVIKELLNLGLSQKEAEVYLATLQLGFASVQKIALKAEVNRTTTYTHVKNLMARGLLSTMDKNGRQFIVAAKPSKLKFYFDRQAKEIERQRESLSKIMPELESLYSIDSDRPSVRFYGNKNLDSLRQEMKDSRADEMCGIFNYEHFGDTLSKTFLKQLLESTLQYKKIYISHNKVLDRKLHDLKSHERFSVKYLPFSKFNCLCEIVVGDTQMFIARKNDSLIIKDPLFSQTFKILFGVLWDLAEEF